MAEAMAFARPVVATGYSGNLTFMTHENSWLDSVDRDVGARGCPALPRRHFLGRP